VFVIEKCFCLVDEFSCDAAHCSENCCAKVGRILESLVWQLICAFLQARNLNSEMIHDNFLD
jgi:hypothetical protein